MINTIEKPLVCTKKISISKLILGIISDLAIALSIGIAITALVNPYIEHIIYHVYSR